MWKAREKINAKKESEKGKNDRFKAMADLRKQEFSARDERAQKAQSSRDYKSLNDLAQKEEDDAQYNLRRLDETGDQAYATYAMEHQGRASEYRKQAGELNPTSTMETVSPIAPIKQGVTASPSENPVTIQPGSILSKGRGPMPPLGAGNPPSFLLPRVPAGGQRKVKQDAAKQKTKEANAEWNRREAVRQKDRIVAKQTPGASSGSGGGKGTEGERLSALKAKHQNNVPDMIRAMSSLPNTKQIDLLRQYDNGVPYKRVDVQLRQALKPKKAEEPDLVALLSGGKKSKPPSTVVPPKKQSPRDLYNKYRSQGKPPAEAKKLAGIK
jgi:hypothetical protein